MREEERARENEENGGREESGESECVVTGRGSGEEGKGGSALNFFLLKFQYVLSLV